LTRVVLNCFSPNVEKINRFNFSKTLGFYLSAEVLNHLQAQIPSINSLSNNQQRVFKLGSFRESKDVFHPSGLLGQRTHQYGSLSSSALPSV